MRTRTVSCGCRSGSRVSVGRSESLARKFRSQRLGFRDRVLRLRFALLGQFARGLAAQVVEHASGTITPAGRFDREFAQLERRVAEPAELFADLVGVVGLLRGRFERAGPRRACASGIGVA